MARSYKLYFGSILGLGFPVRAPQYEPLPSFKGSEVCALILYMVYNGVIMGL